MYLFFHKGGTKKGNKGSMGEEQVHQGPDPPQTKVENLELEKL